MRSRHPLYFLFAASAVFAALALPVPAQTDPVVELRARQMINSAEELLSGRQDERALRILEQVPRLYPESLARFRASLLLGQMHVGKRRFDDAMRVFQQVLVSENDDERAEATYRIGICQYYMNDYEQAFISLRRVTDEFPWSVFANEAYYYIGMSHFKLLRWGMAVEALRMVGTSVPTDVETVSRAEAGQRLYIKVRDKDQAVLLKDDQTFAVRVAAASGDRETVTMEPLGRQGEDYIGSIETELGAPVPGDGTLQIRSGDTIKVVYVDINTEGGERNVNRITGVRMISTARLAIMDGAFVESLPYVVANQPAHLQLVDADLDVSAQRDEVRIPVTVRYRVKREDDGSGGVDLEQDPANAWVERTTAEVVLAETAAHSGIFRGVFMPIIRGAEGSEADVRDIMTVDVEAHDSILLHYVDENHIDGDAPRDVRVSANVVLGTIPDVTSPEYTVDEPNMRARKFLIEANIFLQWGQIFKEVGLVNQANEKADEGLERLDSVMLTYRQYGFERSLVEEAFRTRWELLIVKDMLTEAVNVCLQLIRIFPDSVLADQAFLAIGRSKMEAELHGEAVSIFSQILRIPNAPTRAEAQYLIGEAREAQAQAAARGTDRKPNFSAAMAEYRRCADNYPDSKFAGEALKKIINYYFISEDYTRVVESVQVLLQDYQDAPWLDEMLLRGGAAAFRLGNLQLAKEWFSRIQETYPTGASAESARRFLDVVNQRLGG